MKSPGLFTIRLAALLTLLLVFMPGQGFSETKLSWMDGFPMRMGGQVLLMWMPFPGAAKYHITRNEPETGAVVAWEAAGNNFMDTQASFEKAFVYTVKALTAEGLTLAVTSASRIEGYRELDPPEWGGTHQSEGKIFLVWHGDPRTVHYNLYKAEENAKPQIAGTTNKTSYVDRDVKAGKTYTYFLRALDQLGRESKGSEPLTLTAESAAAKVEEKLQTRKVEITRFALAQEVRLGEPTELLIRKGFFYVTDTGSRSVMVLGPDGKLIRRFGTKPIEYKGAWGIPWGIAADSYGKRFAVTFLLSPNVRVFDENGQMVQDNVIEPPPDLEPAKRLPAKPQPMDVAMEEQEGLWITEYTYGQIIFLDVRGVEGGRVGTARPLENSGPFKSPTFLMMDAKDKALSVVDSLQSRIFKMTLDGEIIGFWGNNLEGPGSLHLPKGITLYGENEILVVDGILSTLQAFDKKGKLLAVYEPDEKNGVPMPKGMVNVAVDGENGDIYVVSKIENAIFRLRPRNP